VTAIPWILIGGIIGCVASCVIVTLLWAKCWNSEVDELDDGVFIVGHTLSTASCFIFMVSYLLTILSIGAKEKNPILLILVALVVGLLGILILPFGYIRMKWLSLLACSINVVFLFRLVFFYGN
jgi:hypothetical protein